MERVAAQLPDVPEGLTVYVTGYIPQVDKKGKRGQLLLIVEGFDGVRMGKPRYTWTHKSIYNLPRASSLTAWTVT